MELAFTGKEQAFRDQVRGFIRERLPNDLRDKVLTSKHLGRDDYLLWHRRLFERGWIAPNWPTEFGGPGWSPVERQIFADETAEAGAPPVLSFGITMCGPVIMRFGSERQKSYFLPRILSGEHLWCQGFSEPGSGSDLASLRTRAVKQGDHYIVNGQKIWTTAAHFADWIFLLVRTDPAAKKKQEGISFLLVDMKSPGITVRPIVTMDGSAEINETFFDDVKVPVENLVGEENMGWTYAKFLLGNERVGIARVGACKREMRRLKEIAAAEPADDGRLIESPRFRDKIAQLEIDLMALEITNLRLIASLRDGGDPGAVPSILKIKGSEVQQRLTELMMEALGPYAAPFQREALEEGWNEEPIGPNYAPPLARTYFNFRKVSIYGGSNEIQKNIVAKATLGL
ncbi:MAG TPA: acyl-CoA dehydrogenase family protein [Stellaceae bacterium]|nr:acyl-CoA dehydrogenase family protein [Stellaceae bacterium]